MPDMFETTEVVMLAVSMWRILWVLSDVWRPCDGMSATGQSLGDSVLP